MRISTLFLVPLLLVSPYALGETPPTCLPISAACLASLSMEPYGPEIQVSDPRYLDIVRRGLGAVPELADLLDDDTPTTRPVPLFGGTWAVGDIAMSAISDVITDVPWLSFASPNARRTGRDCGFCVYWRFVRVSPRNRSVIRTRFRSWYSRNAPHLTWVPNSDLLTGGSYLASRHPSPR